MLKRISMLCLVLSLVLALSLEASADGKESLHINYITDVFNEENGLPTGEANAVVQTKDGYLWVGSYGGLLRYDGTTFVDFSGKLDSSAIRSLFCAEDGTLYIGTNDAGLWKLADNEFTRVHAADENALLCIRDISEGSDGTIYIASTSGAARIVSGELVPYDYPELDGAQLRCIAADGEGHTWALSDAGEIFIFDDARFIAAPPSDVFFRDEIVNALCGSEDGFIWLGSSARILRLELRPGMDPGMPDSFLIRSFFTSGISTINKMKAAWDGTLLVSGLTGFGFIDENGQFRRISDSSDNPISANWAELDSEGNRWVASSNFGIVRYCVGCFDSCNYNSNLGSYSVNAVARQGSTFYVGTDSGILLFGRNWRPIASELIETFSDIRVRNVTVDADGRVWLATYSSHGAACYDPQTGVLTDFGQNEGLLSEKVRVVYPLSDGRMLVGSQLGVNIIENGVITASYGSSEGLETTSILCAMELNGRIFVGTDGSGIYEITDGGLIHIGRNEGLTQGVVLRMSADADGSGNYFVCAGDKLFYCENGSFRVLTGFSTGAGSIYSVYDVNGRIWLLQNGGVFSADKKDVLAGRETYTAQYGVRCGMTGTLSANTWNWLEPDGSLYMPTRSGISVFHFRGTDVQLPEAAVNSISVDGTVYEHPTALILPRDAQRVNMDISELLFSDTTEFFLSYQLEGFDEEEIVTSAKHVDASYTNLRGGDYVLRVRVIDPLTGRVSRETSVTMKKEMQLSEYLWFWASVAALVLLVLLGLERLNHKRKTAAMQRKQEEQRSYINEITKVISECVDMKDAYTNGHSARVAKYTVMLARHLGKTEEETENLYNIALLHDIGKISIPDNILNKPERLTDEEYEIMKSHSQRGYDILKEITIAPELAIGAGYHHERLDGTGYPRGLKGDEIPEFAQIIAVADTFDAMYSTRPYRTRMPLSKVADEIRRVSGTQLNPDVVNAFLELVDEGAFDNE